MRRPRSDTAVGVEIPPVRTLNDAGQRWYNRLRALTWLREEEIHEESCLADARTAGDPAVSGCTQVSSMSTKARATGGCGKQPSVRAGDSIDCPGLRAARFLWTRSVELYYGPTGAVRNRLSRFTQCHDRQDQVYGSGDVRAPILNVKVEADRTITTSAGTQAHFYAITGSTPAARQGMLRLVVFRNGSRFAWLVLACYANEYESNATVRNQWLTAVNSFVWTSG